ncbi:MAG: ABC transporter permease [Firmicutes bacterium]|nr:ABC transporter permease [Bacillota bacterium]
MVIFSTFFSVIIGLPLGILVVITEKNGIWEKPKLNWILETIINVSRSFPFIILMILVFPLSRIIVGSTIGTTASIVPLSVAASPFVARIIENSIKEVDNRVIESVISMGAKPIDIILKVLIPEAMPSIVLGITLTMINLVGFSAMAGAIGGGGLGDLAIRYGFYRFQTDIMMSSVILIIIIVQSIQFIGNKLSKAVNKN